MKKIKRNSILHDCDAETVYLSDVSPSDECWDKHKSNSDKVSNFYYDLGKGKYANRLNKCSGYLEFVLKENSDSDTKFKLTEAKFCRVRNCPVCQWRRSLVWIARLHQSVPKILEAYPKYKLIFLTLTVKNCDVNELKNTVAWMNKAWKKLTNYKVFPGVGWIKSLEVTRPNDDEAHPHFHCILLVPNSYFTGKYYLSKNKWIELWQKVLKVDYRPSIDVKKVKLKSTSQKKIEKKLGRELTEVEKVTYALIEVAKYSVKESDLTASAKWLEAITKQLHKTRAISLGGVFKEYMSEQEPEDLLNLESEEVEVSQEDARFMFGWDGKKKRYRSI